MSVKLPPPLPPFRTVLGAIDVEGRTTSRRAGNVGLSVVRAATPARSGKLRKGQRVKITRTAVGFRIEVSPTSRVRYPSGVTAREVTRWVDRGTGIFGPRGRRITSRTGRPFRLPGGFRTTSLAGQRAQHFYSRAQTRADAGVERELRAGAFAAARAAEDVYREALR